MVETFGDALKACMMAGVGKAPSGDPAAESFEAWTVPELAAAVGAHERVIRRWMSNSAKPSTLKLRGLVRALSRADAPPEHIALRKRLAQAYAGDAEDTPPEADPPEIDLNWAPGPLPLLTLLVSAPLVLAGYGTSWSAWIISGALLTAGFAWIFEASLRKPESRIQLADFFSNEHYARSYRGALGYVLGRTDSWVLSQRQRDSYPDTSVRRAWTVRLFALSILIASIYPTIMMFLHWLIVDERIQSVSFGRDTLLYADTNFFGKLLTIMLYLGSYLVAVRASRDGGGRRWPWFLAAIVLALLGLAALGLAFGPRNEGASQTYNGFMGTVLTGVACAFALLCYFRAVEVIIGPATAAAVGGATIAVLAGPIDDWATWISAGDRQSYRLAFDWTSSFLNAAVTIGCSIPLVLLVRRIIDRPGSLTPVVCVLFTIVTVGLLAFGAGFLETWTDYYLYIGLIPIVNAIFDFGSIGLTRWALRRGLRKVGWQTLAYSALDLAAAILVFLALGCFCIFVLHIVNTLALSVPDSAGKPVVNLSPTSCDVQNPLGETIFQQIAETPTAHTWLYFTFLTTLIPTLLHANVAVWSVGPALLGEKTRAATVNRLEGAVGTPGEQIRLVLPLAVWSAVACLLPTFLIITAVHTVFENSCDLGYQLVNFFIRFLHLLIDHDDTVGLLDVRHLCDG